MKDTMHHCRISMLLVRRDGPFLKSELSSISEMMQAVTDAVAKASAGTIRVYVEVEPRLLPEPAADTTERGASMPIHAQDAGSSSAKIRKPGRNR